MENESSRVQIDSAAAPPRLPPAVADVVRDAEPPSSMSPGTKRGLIIGSIAAVGFLIVMGLTIWWLYQPTTPTERIRDIFIIVMALVSMFTSVTLVLLLIQLARLIILLQTEIKPILDSTNEAVSSLRGTTIFLSDNLVEPVMKLNEYMAGFSQLIGIIGLGKKARRKSSDHSSR
jgi:predicted tellurium resistance membrane protein TerC